MLTLTGLIRAATQVGGGVDRKNGGTFPTRSVLQVEGTDSRGLVQLYTLTVPDHSLYVARIGEEISVPVRAYAAGGSVGLAYEPQRA
jgi:hypothetical protein